mmetsp:Transcript_35648/g.89908  ORF Transcript_35648/g.89908 Transcript_35648/m.89908 type:complete len:461 (+) Transcript_35648:360-1742(+)
MEAAGGTGGVCRAQERLDAAQRKLHEAEEADSVDEVWVAKAELGVAKAKVGVAEASGDAVRVAEARVGVAEAKVGVAEASGDGVRVAEARVGVAKAELGVAESKWEAAPQEQKDRLWTLVESAQRAVETLRAAAPPHGELNKDVNKNLQSMLELQKKQWEEQKKQAEEQAEEQKERHQQLLHQLKREEEQSIAMSNCDKATFSSLLNQLSLRIVHERVEFAPDTDFTAFDWSDAAEDQQMSECLQHLKQIVSIPDTLAWYDVHSNKHYLDSDVPVLNRSLKGTTDLIVAEIVYADDGDDRHALALLVELKKPATLRLRREECLRQTYLELIAQSVYAESKWKPLAVLTDLNDFWRIMWFQGRELHVAATARNFAVLFLSHTLSTTDNPILQYCDGVSQRTRFVAMSQRDVGAGEFASVTGDVGNALLLDLDLDEGERRRALNEATISNIVCANQWLKMYS